MTRIVIFVRMNCRRKERALINKEQRTAEAVDIEERGREPLRGQLGRVRGGGTGGESEATRVSSAGN